MKSASVILVEDGDKILAVSRRGKYHDYGLPGGKVEAGETPITAAAREFYEETGARVANLREVGEPVMNVDYKVHLFSGELIGDVADHINSEDCSVAWVTAEVLCAGSFGEYNVKRVKPLLGND